MRTPTTIAALALTAASVSADGEPVRSQIDVEKDARLALVDVDGDGDLDLVRLDEQGVAVHPLIERTYAPEPALRLPWPAEDLGWTLADLDEDGRTRLVVYANGSEVRSYALDGSEAAEEGRVEFRFEGQVPRGRFEMRFLRDVNGDGRLDLVLPALGTFAIHLARAAAQEAPDDPDVIGRFAAPIHVRLQADVRIDVGDPSRLSSSFGLDVDVPWFTIEDVDGDGDADLVAETEDLVQFHLAEPALSPAPSWTLDLASLRKELPPEEDFDVSNVLAVLGRTLEWKLVDLDGHVPHELVLQVGSTFRVYRDAARTGPTGTPQVLKSSGNVLAFALRDVEGSELEDLVILRAKDLSVASLLRFLVLPGSLDFQLFTYRNDEGAFSRRPTRRNTIRLEVPRLLALAKEIEEMEEREEEEGVTITARRFALEVGGEEDDVVDLVDAELVVYADCAPALTSDQSRGSELDEVFETLMFEDGERLEDGATRTFDVGEFTKPPTKDGPTLRAACAGAQPVVRVPTTIDTEDVTLSARDLDGDGRNDVVLTAEREEGGWRLEFVVL